MWAFSFSQWFNLFPGALCPPCSYWRNDGALLDDDDEDGDDDVPLLAVIGGMMVHSVLKSQQIGQHITTDGKPIPANGGV